MQSYFILYISFTRLEFQILETRKLNLRQSDHRTKITQLLKLAFKPRSSYSSLLHVSPHSASSKCYLALPHPLRFPWACSQPAPVSHIGGLPSGCQSLLGLCVQRAVGAWEICIFSESSGVQGPSLSMQNSSKLTCTTFSIGTETKSPTG